MRFLACRRLRPYVWQPGTSGHRAIQCPFSSRFRSTLYVVISATLFRYRVQDPVRSTPASRAGGLARVHRHRRFTGATPHPDLRAILPEHLTSTSRQPAQDLAPSHPATGYWQMSRVIDTSLSARMPSARLCGSTSPESEAGHTRPGPAIGPSSPNTGSRRCPDRSHPGRPRLRNTGQASAQIATSPGYGRCYRCPPIRPRHWEGGREMASEGTNRWSRARDPRTRRFHRSARGSRTSLEERPHRQRHGISRPHRRRRRSFPQG